VSGAPTIWHNPRCSKSRAALALLEERGFAPRIVLYLETPPTEKELKAALKALGARPRDILRKGEEACRALGLDDESLSDGALIRAMAKNPVLIERPIVFAGGRAAIGRPPQAVLAIL
jgi:arsenate reductase